jgi:RNA polymerase sigma factor (sigma-70 family)
MSELHATNYSQVQDPRDSGIPGCLDSVGLETLVVRVAHDDCDAFRVLFRRCCRWMAKIGAEVLADQNETEQLIEEVFQVIWRRAYLFDPTQATAADWLKRLTYLCAFTLRSRRLLSGLHRVKPVFEERDEWLRRALSPDSQIVDVFQQLPETQQRILKLLYYQGRTYKEIGEILGMRRDQLASEHIAAITALREARMNRGPR